MLTGEQNRLVVRPEGEESLVELIGNDYRADTAFFCGPPGSLSSGRERDIFIDLSGMSAVREHVLSDMVMAVETGISMRDLSVLLAEHRQFFPVDIKDPQVRLIDVIGAGDGGYLEQSFGYLRSQILGLEMVYEGGKRAKLGGRVVKNVTGFDLTKLIVGGRGIFGIPYMAHLRLSAAPAERLTFIVSKKSAADLLHLSTKLAASGLPLSCLELIEKVDGNGDQDQVFNLIVGVVGAGSLVADVGAQIRLLVKNFHVRETHYDSLIGDFPQLVAHAPAGLEVSLSKASAAALIDQLSTISGRGHLRYRPAMGRLFLDCTDKAQQEKALSVVRDFLNNTKLKTGGNALAEFDQATISISNPPYEFSSQSARASEAEFGSLVGRLRSTFDPLKCFNPGVSFHGA